MTGRAGSLKKAFASCSFEMLAEFAITPNALRAKSYTDPDFGRVCLSRLYDCLRNEAVARNIGGKWNGGMQAAIGGFHPLAKEIIEHLFKRGRVVPDEAIQSWDPESDSGWPDLAMASHRRNALDLIVTRGASLVPGSAPLTDVSKIDLSAWWKTRTESVQVGQSLPSYIDVLARVAKTSRKLMFIDPFLDPEKSNYGDFPRLLAKLAELNPHLFFEIHVAEKSNIRSPEPFISGLRRCRWTGELALHVWRNFHHRYVLSNLIGIQVPKGLEFFGSGGEPNLWTRLSQKDRELIACKFDPLLQKRQHLESSVATR